MIIIAFGILSYYILLRCKKDARRTCRLTLRKGLKCMEYQTFQDFFLHIVCLYSNYHKPTFFGTTLFCDLLEINWFAVINFHHQDVNYLETNIPDTDYWFAARNICKNKALVKVSCTQNKVILQ